MKRSRWFAVAILTFGGCIDCGNGSATVGSTQNARSAKTSPTHVPITPRGKQEIHTSGTQSPAPDDPGIGLEQFSIDPTPFARKAQIAVVPPNSLEEPGNYATAWPTHLAVENEQFEFRIMTVAGYNKVLGKMGTMANLEAALKPDARAVNVMPMPYSVFRYGGINMAARQEFFQGDQWRGLRWIGGFGQDTACSPHLGYVFEGMSNDGKYFIMLRASVSHPAVQRRWNQECTTDEVASRINKLLAADLSAASANSFTPSLDQLDAVVHSLKFRH